MKIEETCLVCKHSYLKIMPTRPDQSVLVPFCKKKGIIKLDERKSCLLFSPDPQILNLLKNSNPQTAKRIIALKTTQ